MKQPNVENMQEASSLQKVYKWKMFIRIMAIVLAIAAVFLIALFVASAIAKTRRTMSVSSRGGISLSETADFKDATVRLEAEVPDEMTNISGLDIPADVIDGEGSCNGGTSYIAYSFYLKNTTDNTCDFNETVRIVSTSKNADEAVRFRIYRDGVADTYAKRGADGLPEYGTTPFAGDDVILNNVIRDLEGGQVIKYTVVIWLEGDDPECVDNIRGGMTEVKIDFSVITGEDESIRIRPDAFGQSEDLISIKFNKEKNI